MHKQQKTWIEIDTAALAANVQTFRKMISKKTQLWAVVKSNAYGHGLVSFSKAANPGVDGFCVDSVIEGLKLRREGITKPILVLGPTLSSVAKQATDPDITISISNFDALNALVQEIPDSTRRPNIHIKIDSGMHRQGFYGKDIPSLITYCKKNAIRVTGIFSHFASAKDLNYPTFSERQFAEFEKAVRLFKDVGYKKIIVHIAATGGTLINPKYHLDAVRIGIGLFGLYPSKELEVQLADKLALRPILSWKSIISEIKSIEKGEYVGYDMTERVTRATRIAIVPIGYWHGLPWILSSNGSILVNGKRCKIIGRVSMDMTVIDVTDVVCQTGNPVTLIGTDKEEVLSAREIASRANTSPYELITRLNPLIERVIL